MRDLLEAGVHFSTTRAAGTQDERFIFTERGGIYIIDLTQTSELLQEAHDFARNLAERGGTILFVGTKKQAQDAVTQEAARVDALRGPPLARRPAHELAHDHRRIAHLHELRRLKSEGQLDLLPAKERITMLQELRARGNLGGVADLRRQPMRCSSSTCARSSWRCARRAGSACRSSRFVDTNCDPDEADYIIPGNDDAIRSCSLIVRAIADGIAAGQGKVTEQELAAANGDGATAAAGEADAAAEPPSEPAAGAARQRLPRRRPRRPPTNRPSCPPPSRSPPSHSRSPQPHRTSPLRSRPSRPRRRRRPSRAGRPRSPPPRRKEA